MSINQLVMMSELCLVNYGNHIGEYLRYKLKSMGISQTYLAEKLDVTKQAITHKFSKVEMLPSEISAIQKHLPNGFFDEFFEKNPSQRVENSFIASDDIAHYESSFSPDKGLKLTIQIDPLNFDPSHLGALSSSLKEALENFQKQISTK